MRRESEGDEEDKEGSGPGRKQVTVNSPNALRNRESSSKAAALVGKCVTHADALHDSAPTAKVCRTGSPQQKVGGGLTGSMGFHGDSQ